MTIYKRLPKPILSALYGSSGGLVGAGLIGEPSWKLLGGELAGRALGAALVGCFISLLVALTEPVFRQAWFVVHYCGRESRSVTLGVEPVSFGSEARRCTVASPGAPQVAYTYWFRDGKVMWNAVANRQTEDVPMGSQHAVGGVQVSVHGGGAGAAAPAPDPVTKPPLPLLPPRPPAPVACKPPHSSASPKPAPSPVIVRSPPPSPRA